MCVSLTVIIISKCNNCLNLPPRNVKMNLFVKTNNKENFAYWTLPSTLVTIWWFVTYITYVQSTNYLVRYMVFDFMDKERCDYRWNLYIAIWCVGNMVDISSRKEFEYTRYRRWNEVQRTLRQYGMTPRCLCACSKIAWSNAFLRLASVKLKLWFCRTLSTTDICMLQKYHDDVINQSHAR